MRAVAETRDLVLKMYRENADREDLSPHETGMMFKHWLDAKVYPTQEAIAVDTGQTKQNVGRYIALASLPDYIIAAFRDPRLLSLRWSSELAGVCAVARPGIKGIGRGIAPSEARPDT